MPRLKQLDTTLAHMPVKIGSSEQRKSMESLAALANQLPAFACAVTAEPPPPCRGTGQGLDKEATTGQGTGTISLQTALHCPKVLPPEAECCCTEPAQHANRESVVSSFAPTSAAAVGESATGAVSSSSSSCSRKPEQTAQQQPARPPNISDAAEQRSPGSTDEQQQQQRQESMPPIYAACRWTVSRFAWLLSLLPLLFLACMGSTARGQAAKLMTGLYDLLLQQPPYQEKGTVYYRLGRTHRSPGRSTDDAGRSLWARMRESRFWWCLFDRSFWARRRDITLRMTRTKVGTEHSKPKAVEVKQRSISWRYALTAVPIKLAFIALLLAACFATSASAMQLHTRALALGFNPLSATPNPCPLPPPFRAGEVFAWSVTTGLNEAPYAAGGGLVDVPAQAAPDPSFLDAYAPEGEQELGDLCSRWEADPEHKWIYGNHPDLTAEQKQQLHAMLLEEKEAFAYALKDLVGYSGDQGPAVLHMKHDKGVWSRDRNFSPLEIGIGREKVAEMLEAGVVVEASTLNARYASAVTMPAKRAPDGTWSDKRFCVDLRGINNTVWLTGTRAAAIHSLPWLIPLAHALTGQTRMTVHLMSTSRRPCGAHSSWAKQHSAGSPQQHQPSLPHVLRRSLAVTQHAFALPQDVRQVETKDLIAAGASTPKHPWLLQPELPPAYVIENVAMQFHTDPAIAQGDFKRICARIGQPTVLDAAQFGSLAHRVRNFWSNLCLPEQLCAAAAQVQRSPKRTARATRQRHNAC
ncbi:hypothetical protein COO60DRAFT_1606168, partial [Scenedesmus sp. NREL 46B-D3]